MKTTFIYALCEPGTRTVKYIGKTDRLKGRFLEHLTKSAKERTHLGNWLRSLSSEPALVVLHEVSEGECWEEEECRYIRCARMLGMALVNATDGGEGTSGHIRSPEYCAAISARQKGVPRGPHTPETREAMRGPRGPRKAPRSPEHRAALSASQKGVPKGPHTPEQNAAKSARMKGVPKSPEHCAAISAAQTGVPWSLARRAASGRGKVVAPKAGR